MRANSPNHQSGFGLLEVLVSVLVLSVGLLGLAGLHMAGMRSNHSAYYRTQATMLSYEIVDRMRVNAAQARSSAYDVAAIGADDYSAPGTDDQADTDLADWRTSLSAVLPSYNGSIDCDNNGDCLVVVQWDDSRPERQASAESDGGGGEGDGDAAAAAEEAEASPTSRFDSARELQFSLRTRV